MRCTPRISQLIRPARIAVVSRMPVRRSMPVQVAPQRNSICHFSVFKSRFHTFAVPRRSMSAATEPAAANAGDATSTETPPPASAEAKEEEAAAADAEAEATAEGGEETAAAGEGAEETYDEAGETQQERENYFKATIEREEKQAWDDIQTFQKRVAAQHKLQQQILLKLIQEVNELEEQDTREEAAMNELLHTFGDTWKESIRKTEEMRKKQ